MKGVPVDIQLVYAVLIDVARRKVGLNIKDSTLPAKVAHYEGLYSLFGGHVEVNESPQQAIAHELREEAPGFLSDGEILGAEWVMSDEEKGVGIYIVYTDLSGDRHNRRESRIGLLARVCTEGDGVVRSIDHVWSAPDDRFVPGVREAVVAAIRHADERQEQLRQLNLGRAQTVAFGDK